MCRTALVSRPGIAAAPLQISDVARATQIGEGPAPAGAPGKGRHTPPLPADPKLPTLWLIGDSTVRDGTSGENGPTGLWGWGVLVSGYSGSIEHPSRQRHP